MFVSNSDNLGATLDPHILTHIASSGSPFMMEVCGRLEGDKKGGHLCRRKTDNSIILRETAQCHQEDVQSFQNTNIHPFFNTNNLWVNLERLLERMEEYEVF